jgi:hypothetical protein
MISRGPPSCLGLRLLRAELNNCCNSFFGPKIMRYFDNKAAKRQLKKWHEQILHSGQTLLEQVFRILRCFQVSADLI